jgi:hypothetical protein
MNAAAQGAFAAALDAFAADDFAAAAAAASRAAAADPGSLLAREAATYLGRVARDGKAGVYVTGEAFGAFIRGGGNVPLYKAVSAALREAYPHDEPFSLLDVGVGDGLALLPALPPNLARVDLVEPSAAMLVGVAEALEANNVVYHAFNGTIQAFAASRDGSWHVAQATFSLQSLPPDERRAALAWLGEHAGRLLIAEFDVPDLGEGLDPRRAAHFAARYEAGLAEYAGDGGLVAQGFLMPVFFGYFDPTAARTNYEQPIDAWAADLRAAGFARVDRRHLYDYWWAPCYLLDALALERLSKES